MPPHPSVVDPPYLVCSVTSLQICVVVIAVMYSKY